MNNKMTGKFSNKAKLALVGIAVLAAGAVGTTAYLTDSADTEIIITSATLDLTVNDAQNGPYEVDFNDAGGAGSITNVAPGETRSGTITIKNDGSIPTVVDYAAEFIVGEGQPETEYEFSIKDSEGEIFTNTTLAPGASEELTLEMSLPADVTETAASQNFNLTFNAGQVK